MNRRDFLKNLGLGLPALPFLPKLIKGMAETEEPETVTSPEVVSGLKLSSAASSFNVGDLVYVDTNFDGKLTVSSGKTSPVGVAMNDISAGDLIEVKL